MNFAYLTINIIIPKENNAAKIKNRLSTSPPPKNLVVYIVSLKQESRPAHGVQLDRYPKG